MSAPRPRARRTPPSPFIQHNANAPEVVQAAQIALMVMKKLRVNRWQDVMVKATERDVRHVVQLTETQQWLLDSHLHILPHLSVKPLTTVYGCDTCGLYGLVGNGSPGAKCTLTMHCPGKVHKASTQAPRNGAKAA